MNRKIKTTTIKIETTYEDVLLKGELEFWAKDYTLKMISPFETQCSSHLQYVNPAKYVIKKSESPSCIEIDLIEKSKEILKTMYLKRKILMSRATKEANKKYNEVTKDMNEQEKKDYDFIVGMQNKYELLVRELHSRLFPEENDFMLDSSVDAKLRNKGENPMCKEYIDKMNKKREKLGFLPLSENGYAQDSDKTEEYCRKLISGEIKAKEMIFKKK